MMIAEQVLLEDCETPGGLECGNGVDGEIAEGAPEIRPFLLD